MKRPRSVITTTEDDEMEHLLSIVGSTTTQYSTAVDQNASRTSLLETTAPQAHHQPPMIKDEEMDWNTLDDDDDNDDDSDSEGCFQDANEFQVMPEDFYWTQQPDGDRLRMMKDQSKRQVRPSYYDYESTIRDDDDEPIMTPASFEDEEDATTTSSSTPIEVATRLFLQPQPLEITGADSWKTVMGNIEQRLTALVDNIMNRKDGIENYVNWCERRRRSQTAEMEAAVAARDAEFAANHQEAKIDGDPRTYQRQLLERAKQGNVIVHLGTGYGKTLIALLLIKHVHDDHPTVGTSTTDTTTTTASTTQRRKKTIVLVPSVALALQHSNTLRANLPYTVATACYETSDNTDAYRKQLAAADILVATQGALWDLLLHYQDLVSLDRYALLVVDECHYCAGSHAYRLIFQKFYHTLPLTERPHILGLTASPIINLRERHTEEDLELMVQALQTTMDAVLVSMDPSPTDDVYTHSQTIIEEEIPYQSMGMARSLPSADNLLLHPSRYRELRQLEALYQQVGPLVVSLYCQVLQRELSRNEFEEESPAEFETVLGHLRSVVQWCEQESRTQGNQGRTDKLLALESVLERELSANPTETVGLVFCHRRITAVALHHYFSWRENQKGRLGEQYGWGKSGDRRRWCQEKIMIPRIEGVSDDEDMFADASDDPFLAFHEAGKASDVVDSKMHKTVSVDRFTNDDDADMGGSGEMDDVGPSKACIASAASWMKTTRIRSTVLVRNITSIFNSLSIDHCEVSDEDKKQWLHVDHRVRDVLTKLRRKELNLLFATSVVEEGVDVQACSVVVAFDSIRSTKSYVQMKGRARKRKAKFFVFQDSAEIPGKATVSLESARNMEARLRSFIANKALGEVDSEDQNAMANDASDYELPLTLEPELSAVRTGSYKGNHGTVDLQSAKGLLTRYCLSVALDPHVRFSREALIAYMPDFRENVLVLPSHLPSNIRVVSLPTQCHDKPKRDKHKILSLMACVRLHCHGLLNDRLLPLSKADMHQHILRATKAEFPAIKMPMLPLGLFFDVHEARIEVFVRTISWHGEGFFHTQQQLKGEGHQLALVTITDSFSDLPSFFVNHKEFGQVETQYGNSIPAICDDIHFGILREFFTLLMDERWRRSSRQMYFKNRGKEDYVSVLMPYVVGLVSRYGELDWDFMKQILMESRRTEFEREAAVTRLSIEEGLVAPRLWISTIDDHTKYIAYGPSDETVSARFPVEKEGISTYKEYFEKVRGTAVASGIQLFDVQRYWVLPSSFSSLSFSEPEHESVLKVGDSKYPMCRQLSAIKIPQSVLREARIANAHIGLLSCFLPQALFVYERCVTTGAFIEFCETNLPKLGSYLNRLPLETVAASMTSKSCGMDVSYERLEWLGDSVLKMMQTESLLKSIDLKDWVQVLHEGDLSMLRQEMGSNKRLELASKNWELGSFIMSANLARGQWLPSLLNFCEGSLLPPRIENNSKIFADVIESILGLVYLEFGYRAAFAVGDELQVTVPWEEPPEVDTTTSKTSIKSVAIGNAQLWDAVRRTTGYTSMRRTELFEEAFSHASAGNPTVSSYERLEWTGDAVLCLTVRKWIWDNFPEADLVHMVTMESAIISNEVLAFIAVQTGLHHFLQHKDQTLPGRIEAYICSIRQDGRGLWSTDPPKVIADIVESLIGAIYVDVGLETAMQACRNLLKPVLDVLLVSSVPDTIDLEHPKKRLQELVGSLLVVDVTWEDAFQQQDKPIVDGNHLRFADPQGTHAIAYIHFMDTILLAVSDPSRAVARNKACAIMVQVLTCQVELLQQLQDLRHIAERAVMTRASTDSEDEHDTVGGLY